MKVLKIHFAVENEKILSYFFSKLHINSYILSTSNKLMTPVHIFSRVKFYVEFNYSRILKYHQKIIILKRLKILVTVRGTF